MLIQRLLQYIETTMTTTVDTEEKKKSRRRSVLRILVDCKRKQNNNLPCSITMSATDGNRICFSFFNSPKQGNGTGRVT